MTEEQVVKRTECRDIFCEVYQFHGEMLQIWIALRDSVEEKRLQYRSRLAFATG